MRNEMVDEEDHDKNNHLNIHQQPSSTFSSRPSSLPPPSSIFQQSPPSHSSSSTTTNNMISHLTTISHEMEELNALWFKILFLFVIYDLWFVKLICDLWNGFKNMTKMMMMNNFFSQSDFYQFIYKILKITIPFYYISFFFFSL